MANISCMMDPRINITEPSKDCLDSWSKKFMLKTIHIGANKMTSNATTIEFYDTVIDGVREYHTTVLKDTEIDKRKIAPPPKVRLNKDNIRIPQNALLITFRKDTQNKGNPYNILHNQHCGKLYSIMHGEIQKFGKELNGVFIRTLSETSDIVNNIALKEIEGH